MDDESKYSYSIEELDNILRKMEQGITPLIPDDMMKEVKLRKKELELWRGDSDEDDEDYEEYLSEVEKHKKLVKYLEEQKHKATKKEAYIYTMTPEQLKEIEEDMGTTFVRENPNSPYNRPSFDSEMSDEKKAIMIKLSKLRNCYYNQKEYQEAIETIRQAVEISLKTDYPWLSPEQAIQKFRNKEIVYSYGQLPKIYLNYITPVTDPLTAKKIASGEITLIDKNSKTGPKKRRNRTGKTVSMPVHIIDKKEVDTERRAFDMGQDSPLSVVFKGSINAYGRFDMPNSGYFQKDEITPYDQERNEAIMNFDWMQPNAAEKYYNLVNNVDDTVSVHEFINKIQKEDKVDLNSVITNNMTEFLQDMGHGSNSDEINFTHDTNHYDYIRSILQPNQKALAIEEQLLENIRNSNE